MIWHSIRFEELYSTPSRNGVYKSKEFHGSGAKIVNMGELFAHEFIGQQEMKRLQMSDSELEKAALVEGDLLFGRRSLVEAGAGKCSIVTSLTGPTTFESSLIRVRVRRELINPRFLYYWFRSRVGRGRVSAIVSGVNVKGIRGSDLKNIEVDYPDLPTQDRIVAVLSAYDDLIEKNRRRIVLLEQAARLLYREWFVHFRFPGHETAKFVDGLPEWWEECSFADMAEYLNGFAFKPYHLGKHGLPIVKIPELKNGILDKTPYYEGREVPDKYLLTDGNLIFSWSGTLAIDFWNTGNAYLNQHLFKVTPKDGFSEALILTAVRESMPKFMGKAVGATMKHIRRSALDEVKHPLPPGQLLKEFNDLITKKYDHVQLLRKQNVQLAKARDLLLPRLMDGRIPIKV